MTTRRKKITESTRTLVAGSQYFKCANNNEVELDGIGKYRCPLWNGANNGSFDQAGFEIDHKYEHCLSEDDNIDNLQALCKSCHQIKTKMFQRSDTVKNLRKDQKNKKKLNTFTKIELQDVLKQNDKKTSGTKMELIDRIIELKLDIKLNISSGTYSDTSTDDDLTYHKQKCKQKIPPRRSATFSESDFTLKNLKLICIYLDISPYGTKDKVVNKINKEMVNIGYNKDQILDDMKNGKYMIVCNDKDGNNKHIYFTNKKLSSDNTKLINDHRDVDIKRCPNCKKSNRYILEYLNGIFDNNMVSN